jgi:hypothetical protein
LGLTPYHEWYQLLKSGKILIEDETKFGRPSTSMDVDYVEKVHALFRQSRRLTVGEIAE